MRIIGLDFARAIALAGMYIVNAKLATGATGIGILNTFVDFLDGRAAALFVVLSGMGVSMSAAAVQSSGENHRITATRLALIKRAIVLIVLGILLMQVWEADILHCYGIFFLVGALMLSAKKSTLILSTALSMALFPLLFSLLDFDKGWNWQALTYQEILSPQGFVRSTFFNGFTPVFPWLSFFLFGMLLGRLDWTNLVLPKKIAAVGMVLTLVTQVTSTTLVKMAQHKWGLSPGDAIALFGTDPIPPLPLFYVSALGSTCATIGLSVLITAWISQTKYLESFANAGRMTLTFYISHIVIGMLILDFTQWSGQGKMSQVVAGALLFFAVSMIFAGIWGRYFKYGPFELLTRLLVNGKLAQTKLRNRNDPTF